MSEKLGPSDIIGQCKHGLNQTICDECSPIKKVNFYDRIAPFTHDQCQHLYEQAIKERDELRAENERLIAALKECVRTRTDDCYCYDPSDLLKEIGIDPKRWGESALNQTEGEK